MRVAKGNVKAESYLPAVFVGDDGDEPFLNEDIWHKTNPSLPVLPGYNYLREQVERANGMPSLRATVARLCFCVWADQTETLFSRERWEALLVDSLDEERLRHLPCYGGLDLSVRKDLTAFVVVWPDGDRAYVRSYAWTPADTLLERRDEALVPLRLWASGGDLLTTPGNVIDYGVVGRHMLSIRERYNLRGVAFDRFRIKYLKDALAEEGVRTSESIHDKGALYFEEHPQGYGKMWGRANSEDAVSLWMPRSIECLEDFVLEGRLVVEENPVLTAAVMSAQVRKDMQLNRTFEKGKTAMHIDPAVALAMALGLMDQMEHVPTNFYSGPVDLWA